MVQRGTRSVLLAAGRALAGASAGLLIGPLVGIPFLLILRTRFALEGRTTADLAIAYLKGSASVSALLGILFGASFGAKMFSSTARTKIIHPLGLLIGVVAGADIGAAVVYLSASGPELLYDVSGGITLIGIIAVLGGIVGGLLGATARAMIGAAMIGCVIVGIGSVFAFQNIKGMLYGGLYGAPLGALCGFLLRLRSDVAKPPDKAPDAPTSGTVWDPELDQ